MTTDTTGDVRRETCLTLATHVVAAAANDPAVMEYVAVNAIYRLELLAASEECLSCGAIAALAELSEEVEQIVAARNSPAPTPPGKFRPWGWLAWIAWIMAWATITGGLMVLSDGYGW